MTDMDHPPAIKPALSQAKRALLEKRLKGQSIGKSRNRGIAPRGDQGPAPLSFGQERLWFLHQLDPDSAAYNIGATVRMVGDLDIPLLEKCLDRLVERHESLRTRIRVEGDRPLQEISPPEPIELPVESIENAPEEERETALIERIRALYAEPFRLMEGGLVRAVLLRKSPREHALVLVIHHIVSDAWSQGILFGELFEMYESAVRNRPPDLPDLPVQYADFSGWQRRHLAGEPLESQMKFWENHLRGMQPLEIPTDYPRPAVPTGAGQQLSARLDPERTRELVATARRHNGTLFMLLGSALAVLLRRYSRQEDIAFGLAHACRNRREIEKVTGFFVNSLVMRVDLAGDPTVGQLIERFRKLALDAYAHQDLPFDQLVDRLHPRRELSRNPLFQVIMALQNVPLPSIELSALDLSVIDVDSGTVAFDLEFRFMETRKGLEIRLGYDTALYSESTARRMLEHLQQLLKAMVADPDRRVSELLQPAEEERWLILEDWNQTYTDYPRDAAIHELVARHAKTYPDALAVSGPGGSLTYGALNSAANRLARHLIELGAGPDARIGSLMERSPDMVTALLAILKSGAGYVPIDPAYPPARIDYMLEDSGAPVLLTQKNLRGRLGSYAGRIVAIDEDQTDWTERPATDLEHTASPDRLAYAIYTSGSTGRPKGVEITHGGLANLVHWHIRRYHVKAHDRATQLAALGFDACVWELWPYLAAGASIHMPDEEIRSQPDRLWDWLAREKITLTFMPTPMAEAALSLPLPRRLALRALLTGGDRLRRPPSAPLPFELVNHYGPTENTVVSTCVTVRPAPDGAPPPPIGSPIDNVRCIVVDENMNLAPVGVPGELCVGGDSLARGYINQPELTRRQFVPDPFNADDGQRLYRTGDLVRWRTEGNLDFLGRIDDQVKVRGFRIELGEVETALAELPQVRECVAAVRPDLSGENQLIAWCAPAGEFGMPETAELREILARRLPESMIPSIFMQIEAVPLTPNGKIDRRALPEPDFSQAGLTQYVAPESETEKSIAGIWTELVRRENIGANDNFFECGGNSLRATQLVSRLRARFQIDLPLRVVFENPTVRGLAAAMDAIAWTHREQTPASTAGDREEIEI